MECRLHHTGLHTVAEIVLLVLFGDHRSFVLHPLIPRAMQREGNRERTQFRWTNYPQKIWNLLWQSIIIERVPLIKYYSSYSSTWNHQEKLRYLLKHEKLIFKSIMRHIHCVCIRVNTDIFRKHHVFQPVSNLYRHVFKWNLFLWTAFLAEVLCLLVLMHTNWRTCTRIWIYIQTLCACSSWIKFTAKGLKI